jgi:hypothetical protein
MERLHRSHYRYKKEMVKSFSLVSFKNDTFKICTVKIVHAIKKLCCEKSIKTAAQRIVTSEAQADKFVYHYSNIRNNKFFIKFFYSH